jgi:hypothetical protein
MRLVATELARLAVPGLSWHFEGSDHARTPAPPSSEDDTVLRILRRFDRASDAQAALRASPRPALLPHVEADDPYMTDLLRPQEVCVDLWCDLKHWMGLRELLTHAKQLRRVGVCLRVIDDKTKDPVDLAALDTPAVDKQYPKPTWRMRIDCAPDISTSDAGDEKAPVSGDAAVKSSSQEVATVAAMHVGQSMCVSPMRASDVRQLQRQGYQDAVLQQVQGGKVLQLRVSEATLERAQAVVS